MNTKIFNHLLKKSFVLEDDNMNPTMFTDLIEIEQDKGQTEIYCL